MATEKIEVHYQPIGSLAGLTFYHTLVVYTDLYGHQWAARGGPDSLGNLRTSVGAYVEGHVDWPEDGVVYKKTTVATGEFLLDTWGKIMVIV